MTKFVPRRSARLKQQSKTLQKAINVDNRCFKSDGVINPNNEFNNLQLVTEQLNINHNNAHNDDKNEFNNLVTGNLENEPRDELINVDIIGEVLMADGR